MSKTTSTSTREFRVRWEIDLTADSPEAAARQALEIQRAPAFFATIFEVKWRDPDNVDAHGNGSAHGKRGRKHKLLVDALAVKAAQKPEPEPQLSPEPVSDDHMTRIVGGDTYVARASSRASCLSCAFYCESSEDSGCAFENTLDDALCGPRHGRTDGRFIFWEKSEPEPTPEPETPPPPAPLDPAECTVDGRTYVAVESEGCKGCAANQPGRDAPVCDRTGPCFSISRPDGRSVIWVLKSEPQPEPQPDNESERTVNGVRLKAVPCLDDFIECRGCYLLDDPATVPAMCYSPSCIGSRRADGQDIIWVRQDA